MTQTSTATQTNIDSTVIAEDAPLGVLLWPVIDPTYAPNFTLASVAIIRDAYGQYVSWTYENGKTRTFQLGEAIAVRYSA